MSALHRIEFLKLKDNSATIKIYAVHPDAVHSPSSADYLLQTLISYWDDLRLGYDFCFFNLDLAADEMKRAAENFARKEDFEKWYVLMRGEVKEITKEEYDSVSLAGYGYNPPKEAWDEKDRNEKILEEKLGGKIAVVASRKAGDDAPTVYEVRLYPGTERFVKVAEKIITSKSYGKTRRFKSFSKATQSYGFEEVTFTVSDAAYLAHLHEGTAFEVANVAFSYS